MPHKKLRAVLSRCCETTEKRVFFPKEMPFTDKMLVLSHAVAKVEKQDGKNARKRILRMGENSPILLERSELYLMLALEHELLGGKMADGKSEHARDVLKALKALDLKKKHLHALGEKMFSEAKDPFRKLEIAKCTDLGKDRELEAELLVFEQLKAERKYADAAKMAKKAGFKEEYEEAVNLLLDYHLKKQHWDDGINYALEFGDATASKKMKPVFALEEAKSIIRSFGDYHMAARIAGIGGLHHTSEKFKRIAEIVNK